MVEEDDLLDRRIFGLDIRDISKIKMPRPPKKGKHGGRRAGAGRKPNGPEAGEQHGVRPIVTERNPVHVTLRIAPEIGRLRWPAAYQAWRTALTRVLTRGDFRVIHIAIQATVVHLICEADDRIALANGVRALSISAAHRLNAALSEQDGTARRTGRVFLDRYNAKVIETAEQCRSELAELLTFALPRGYEPLPVSYPTAWLLTKGWARWGVAAGD